MVSNTRMIKVEKGDADSFAAAVDTAVAAFSLLPTWSRLYGDGDVRVRSKVIFFLEACLEVGELWAAMSTSESTFDGVLGLLPPNTSLLDAPSAQDNWAIFMKTLGSEAAATNPQGAQPVIIFQQPQHCPSKMAAAWNIALIGTHPASAGCGVGGVMVDFASERAGTDDVWVYTTYETRMPFYLKRGFVHCQTKRAPDLYGGDADEFVMFRAAVRDS